MMLLGRFFHVASPGHHKQQLLYLNLQQRFAVNSIQRLEKMPRKKESESESNAYSGRAPKRTADGTYHFEDYPQFLPNRSPKEILQAGGFGGTYFRPIKSAVCPRTKFGDEVWKELPKDWIEGLDPATRLCSSTYRAGVNKYKVKCGATLEEWEQSGWIKPQDPYGWFQWYCRFFQGRRTEDDVRQVARWVACAAERSGRWRNRLCSTVYQQGKQFDDYTASPVIRQTLLHWGYELTEEDYRKWGVRQGAEISPKKPSKAAPKLSKSKEDANHDEGDGGHSEDVSKAKSAKRIKVEGEHDHPSKKKKHDDANVSKAKTTVEDEDQIQMVRKSGEPDGDTKAKPRERKRKE